MKYVAKNLVLSVLLILAKVILVKDILVIHVDPTIVEDVIETGSIPKENL